MSKQTITVPDIGTDQAAEVTEVLVEPGDSLEEEQSVVVLETEKASVEVPSSHAGKVLKLLVEEGDEIKTGAPLAELETEAEAASADQAPQEQEQTQEQPQEQAAAPADQEPAPAAESAPRQGGGQYRVPVPDIGGAEGVEVIEIAVAVGDEVAEEDTLITLESEKASMDIPSPAAGKVVEVLVSEGDNVKEGQEIVVLEQAGAAPQAEPQAEQAPQQQAPEPAPQPEAPQAPAGGGEEVRVPIPDIGGAEGVEVIEIAVSVGDEVAEEDTLITLESEKASMDIPSPAAGTVTELLIAEGDTVNQGQEIAVLQKAGAAPAGKAAEQKAPAEPAPAEKPEPAPAPEPAKPAPTPPQAAGPGSATYAGPAVRKLARQLGVELSKVKGTGPRSRVLKDDVRNYVKEIISGKGGGAAIPEVPAVDFSKFGEIERVKLSKIARSTAANMHRSWLNVPHVTQFDEADITDLEAYRKDKQQKKEAEKRGTKLTPVPFLLKACALTLQEEPSFNVSLDPDGQHIIKKKYVHVGMAVDTPKGLVVPVIRDVEQKDLWELAQESMEMADKAREGTLSPSEMQGACFTISSLGAIGGQGFTPIVNTPEVGILGVSKAAVKPHWDGKNFVPRTFLPVSLSYDHRAVNGADAGRFLTHLVELLSKHEDWAK